MKIVHLLIVLNVALFAIMLAVGGPEHLLHFDGRTLLQFGSNWGVLTAHGEWWRLFTSVFIHMSPPHLVMNMVALVQAGTVLESHFGRARFIAVYLLAGV